jgi:hypothetical protein
VALLLVQHRACARSAKTPAVHAQSAFSRAERTSIHGVIAALRRPSCISTTAADD